MELPEGFTARQLVQSDLGDVYAVAEDYDIEMLGEPDLEKANIEAFWKMPNFHLDTDSLGVFDGLRLTAYAEVMMGNTSISASMLTTAAAESALRSDSGRRTGFVPWVPPRPSRVLP